MENYKIVMSAGSVKQDMMRGLTREQAEEICDGYGWEISPDGDGGFVWDLDVEEDE